MIFATLLLVLGSYNIMLQVLQVGCKAVLEQPPCSNAAIFDGNHWGTQHRH